MNKDRLKQVLEILSKYDNSKFVNYYELFNLDKNMSIDELNNIIRKNRLQVLFHPDQIHFIPEEYHSKYLEVVEIVKNVIDTFSSYRNKEKYDSDLKEFLTNNKSNNFNNKAGNDASSSYRSNSSYNQSYSSRTSEANQNKSNEYQEDKTEDLDEIALVEAIVLNSKKYGLDFTMKSLIDLIVINSVKGFTRDNGVREMVSSIPKDKILSIINESSLEDQDLTVKQVVMNYMTDLMYKVPEYKQQIGLIEQACAATFYKYDMNGYHNQTRNALFNYCVTGQVNLFTNDGNVRKYLAERGDIKNAEFYVKCALNKERKVNVNYSYNSVMANGGNFTDMYVKMLNNKNYNNSSNKYDDGNFSR